MSSIICELFVDGLSGPGKDGAFPLYAYFSAIRAGSVGSTDGSHTGGTDLIATNLFLMVENAGSTALYADACSSQNRKHIKIVTYFKDPSKKGKESMDVLSVTTYENITYSFAQKQTESFKEYYAHNIINVIEHAYDALNNDADGFHTISTDLSEKYSITEGRSNEASVGVLYLGVMFTKVIMEHHKIFGGVKEGTHTAEYNVIDGSARAVKG